MANLLKLYRFSFPLISLRHCVLLFAGILAGAAGFYSPPVAYAAETPVAEGAIAAFINAGVSYNCEIKSDNTVACWGLNDDNQATPPAGTFIQISAGSFHTCAIKLDNSAVCWGDNSDGQASPPFGSYIQVAAGLSHTCAIKNNSSVVCWGDDSDNQASPPAGSFTQISAGDYHTCGIKFDASLACWGNNDDNQVSPPGGSFRKIAAGGSHNCAIKNDNTMVCWGYNDDGESTPPAGTFTDVSAGAAHTCAIHTDGTLACWGDNSDGQATPPAGVFIQVAAGETHNCAIRSDGTVVCWGDNTEGQAPTLALSPASLPIASAGAAYNQVLIGSAENYSTTLVGLSLSAGALPPGLSLTNTPSAAVIGTPTQQGSFSFTLRAIDANGLSVEQPYTIIVDTAPIANSQNVATGLNTPLGITLSASDAESDPLTYSIVSNPAHGALSGTAPNLTYTPANNYNGPDSFTFKVNDGKLDSNTATVNINVGPVQPVNTAPIADSQNVATTRNAAKSIILTGSDADSNPLTYSVVTAPANGTLSGTAPNLLYTPANNFTGADSFTFKVNDGQADSNIATINITVSPFNTAPVANAQSLVMIKNTTLPITLTVSDAENDQVSYGIVSLPMSGTLSGTAPNLIYKPNTNFIGNDSFTFKANDGQADSNVATISILVKPNVPTSNFAPLADDQNVLVARNTAKAIKLTGSDPDGNTLTYLVVNAPSHGTLSGAAPNLTYTPQSGYIGADSFTFKATDGKDDSNIATVSIQVVTVNAAPVANDQTINMQQNTGRGIVLTASDSNGDALSYTIVTSPAHGQLNGTAPNLAYIPTAGYTGDDIFTFKVNDGQVDSNIATVLIHILPGNGNNTPPIANDQSRTTRQNTPLNITLTASDAEINPLTYSIVSGPQHGALSGTAPNLTYTPANNFDGVDSFTFKVNDGQADSNIATVTISVGTAATQGSIVGIIFNDKNGDGQKATTEPGLAGVTVTLTGDNFQQQTTTDSDGVYRFNAVPAGTYQLAIVPPAGFLLTGPTQIDITVVATNQVTALPFSLRNFPVFFPLIKRQ